MKAILAVVDFYGKRKHIGYIVSTTTQKAVSVIDFQMWFKLLDTSKRIKISTLNSFYH